MYLLIFTDDKLMQNNDTCILMKNALYYRVIGVADGAAHLVTGAIMKTLQVRELPEHIYRHLTEAAEREHRSLAQQAVVVLARGLGIELSRKEKRCELLSDLKQNPLLEKGKKLPDPVKLVREDRGR